MRDNTDNENTVVFNSGDVQQNDRTQMFVPPNAQQQGQYARPAQPVSDRTQMFAPPNAQQGQYARPAQPVSDRTQMFVPPNAQQQFAQQAQSQQPEPQYKDQQIFGEAPKKKKRVPIALIIAAAVAVTAALIVGLIVLLGRTDEENADSSQVSVAAAEDVEYKKEANSLWKAAASALASWQADGRDVRRALITSDSASEKYDGDGTAEDFREKLREYYPALGSLDYVLIIENGSCTGAAVSDALTSSKIGTYAEGADMSGSTLSEIIASLSAYLGDVSAPTTEDDRVTVPNVVGMKKQEAVDKLGELGLNVIIDGKYSDEYAEDTVIEQSVKSDSKLPKDSDITITLSLGREIDPNVTEVPNVIGIHYELAQEQLRSLGFSVSVSFVESDETEMNVIAQSISPNTEAQKGSSITLSVSSGSSAEPTVEGVDTGMVITGDV
ncbi:MAG: PASTA domain-containing protein, partial [Ruminococcus sp.]|nr:PASTA domain-containing protein [Ruminococcus sp.]